jgi:hypothetical protein
MKTKILTLLIIGAILACSSHPSLAQAGVDWQLLGNGGTNPTNNFVGTTDNNHLVFRTNNTEKARILANGNVGIGIASPNYLLQIHESSTNPVYTQWTNTSVGSASTNGLLIGIDAQDNAVFNMKPSSGFLWLTSSNAQRMKLSAAGQLLVGSYGSFNINNRLV